MKTFWNKRKILNLFRKDLSGLKITDEKPPIYDNVSQAFKILPQAYFTYNDTIHCVGVPNPPSDDIVAHEKLHMKQQQEAGGADLWWGKFLRDPQFRIDQEAQAYAKQYDFLCSKTADRNLRFYYIRQFALSLSGKLYNNCIGLTEAMVIIKKYSNVK